eukprot:182656_1
METVLQVTNQLEMLTDIEFATFINTYGRQRITNLIFEHYHNQLTQIEAINDLKHSFVPEVNKLNDQIRQIIRSRKNKPKQPQQYKLDTICNEMISYISSYLDLPNILNFEKCSRSIFIGTRSPIPSRKFDTYHFNDFWNFFHKTKSIYHWNRFKVSNELNMDVSKCFKQSELNYPNNPIQQYKLHNILTKHPILKDMKLEKLSITFQTQWMGYIGYLEDFTHDIKNCNLSNLTHFKLEIIHPMHCLPEDLEKFLNIINSKSPKLKFVECIADCFFDNIPICVEKIKGISIALSCDGEAGTVDSSNLESIHDVWGLAFNSNFGNLNEICFNSGSRIFDIDYNVIKTQMFPYLKRLHFTADHDRIIEDKILEKLQLFLQSRYIHYICVKVKNSKNLKAVIKLLLVGVNSVGTERMKIKIMLTNIDNDDIDHDVLRLINKLNNQFKDFMLIFVFGGESKSIIIDSLCNSLKDKYLIQCLEITHGIYNGMFVCSNKTCAINGYRE